MLELQLRHGLAADEVASVLGVSRNHAHALMSRARGQLEKALGVLVVARTGRRDCPELDAMLAGWDGQLTVLLRKRINRHVERCATCSQRREEEMKPAAFLGMAPLIALPLAAALPAALRDQVMHAVFGSSPAAVAHRAAVGRAPYSFGHGGFPQPLHPLRPPWWQQHAVHYGTAAGTAAAIAAGVTIAVVPHHHPGGHRAGGGPSVVASGTSPVAAGTHPAATRARCLRRCRHAPGQLRGDGQCQCQRPRRRPPGPDPSLSPSAVAARASAPASRRHRHRRTATRERHDGRDADREPGHLEVQPPDSGTITLTASGGPVDWTVSEPPGLEKKVVVAPMSGSLAAGGTATITVTLQGSGKPTVHLTFSPGGATVTVDIS